jgi:hypothetical protein
MAIHINDGALMRMTGKTLKNAGIGVAVVAVGIAALTGCVTQQKVLTTASAGAYYLATTCKADAVGATFIGAVSIAEQSTAATGPDLDNLKSAALAYEAAARAAATSLQNPKAAWPTSVRKPILVMRGQYLAQLSTLEAMATANQMSDEADAYSDFPDTKKAVAATKLIRSKLGLPSNDAVDACPPPPAISVAPATGVLITGTGYTFDAPAGWALPPTTPQADSYAISAEPDAAGFYDTVNVLVGAANTDSFDEQEQNGPAYLGQVVHATAIQVRPRVEVAGEEGVHVSSQLTRESTTRWSEQYVVAHHGTACTITFTFNEAESQSVREALAESVLASWTWT